MSWIAAAPEAFAGSVIGNGHCVAYVCRACGAPPTAQWRRGDRVRDLGGIEGGTAIATFGADGRYGNHTDGRSHAAIYVGPRSDGFLVWDQWVGHPVQQRVIRLRGGAGKPVNDADQYYVIEPGA